MVNKLELTWIDKDVDIKVEPRILIQNTELSHKSDTKEGITDNMLIHGDNLLALKAIETEFAGMVKCIYIDPPYNTGSAFEFYNDNLEHSIWLGLMRNRLLMLKNLLHENGSIFVQIDDEEYAYLKVLMDEVFGRKNYINTINVLMKNIAGASGGGGEDKRLKKSCEYILVYAKDYEKKDPFKSIHSLTPIDELVVKYKETGKSWKYTSALVNPGEKTYVGSTTTGDGSEIRIYRRDNFVIKSINALIKDENSSVKEIYKKYAKNIFQTAMPESSIRPRVKEKVEEIGIESDLYSIEYVPTSGRNKGVVYEQFYKGASFRLFAWLSDVSEEIDGRLYKKDRQGTFWDFVGELNNLTKEGNVQFPKGKKAERIIERILEMATDENDIVLDSFLGSGTTAAVAHKMGRRWIGVEMGDHAYTHCKKRLDSVIDGTDMGGITKSVNWQGGGGYRFYEIAPTLINTDAFGLPVINKEYNIEMLAAAVAIHEGFKYEPNDEIFWKQSKANENAFLYVTTQHVTQALLNSIEETLNDSEYLIIACKSFDTNADKLFKNITIKKIPQMLLNKCEFGKDNYDLNIVNPPTYEDEQDDESEDCDDE